MIKGKGISPFFNGGGGSQVIGELTSFSYSGSDWDETWKSPLTVTYNASSIDISGAVASAFQDHYIIFKNHYGDCENLVFSCDITVNTVGATDYGCALRLFSNPFPGGSENLGFVLGCATGVNKGQAQLYLGNLDGTVLALGTTMPTLVAGDTIHVDFLIVKNVITINCINLNTPASTCSVTYTFEYDYAPAETLYRAPLYKFALGSLGGSYRFSNLSASTTDRTRCDLMLRGNSITYGLWVGGTDPDLRIDGIWQTNNPTKTIINNAGCGEYTADLLLSLPEIIKYRPKKIIVNMIINDMGFLTDPQTVANMEAFRDALLPYNVDCWFQLSPPSTGFDVTSKNAAVQAAFPTRYIPYPPTWNIATDAPDDGVHENYAGNLKMYTNQALYITL